MLPESVSKVVVRVILNKLDALKVHCPRCYKTLERASFDSHVQQCPVLCPSGCKLKISPSSLEEHSRVCVAVVVTCSAADVQCEWTGTRKELQSHLRTCSFVKQQAVLRRFNALEEEMLRRVTVLEEANNKLRARVALLEGTENL